MKIIELEVILEPPKASRCDLEATGASCLVYGRSKKRGHSHDG